MLSSTASISGATKLQAPMFRGSSWHQTTSACGKRASSRASAFDREGIELLEAHQRDIVDAALGALLEQIVIDLAAAQHDAPDLGIGRQRAGIL